MQYLGAGLSSQQQTLVEHVVADDGEGAFALSAEEQGQVVIDVIHDGNWLPEEFMQDSVGNPVTHEQISSDYIRERDWGASMVANRVATQLGLKSFLRVNLARVLMDFGRFPGSTSADADHLNRFAINSPFSQLLGFHQKQRVLNTYYDGVSSLMEQALAGRLVKIAIHTYDQFNDSGTERPATSLMTRSLSYQNTSELPAGLFDPMYPDVLAEFTADRILRDRISLTLERKQIPVAHNYPYCLPEGSLEVRYQVWNFFRSLQRNFQEARPETVKSHVYEAVWNMLLDTNLRSSESDALRSYLHLFRRAPAGRAREFEQAAHAYVDVRDFCDQTSHEVVNHYRFSKARSSSIAIEVRKDIVCDLGPDGMAVGVNTDNVEFIGDAIAQAVKMYFDEDRTVSLSEPRLQIGRHGPWYAERDVSKSGE